MNYRCALCGSEYHLDQPRRTTRYCEPCRARRKVARQRLYDEHRNRARDNVVDVLNDYTRQGMDEDYVDLMRAQLDDVIDELLPPEREHPELPIEGALTPAGPDEGTSTYFTDLGEALDAHAAEVAEHPWFKAHPEWADGLALDEVDLILKAS